MDCPLVRESGVHRRAGRVTLGFAVALMRSPSHVNPGFTVALVREFGIHRRAGALAWARESGINRRMHWCVDLGFTAALVRSHGRVNLGQ
jgi:hypothetical protein